MLPAEFIKLDTGQLLTSQCSKPLGHDTNEGICPDKCNLHAGNEILRTAQGPVDYQRFCNYNCRPETDAIGSPCKVFDKEWYEKAQTKEGNGKEVHPEPILGIGSDWFTKSGPDVYTGGVGVRGGLPKGTYGAAGPGAEGEAAAPEQKAPELQKQDEKVAITYDLRKIISERMRSEAGASTAAAVAAGERVRINRWQAKKKTDSLINLRRKAAVGAGKVEEHAAGFEVHRREAEKFETQTRKKLAEGRMLATNMMAQVRKLADAAIEKAVAPCAQQAARDRAKAKGLDKPPDWVKVVAARAANPYQKAVTDAVQRTAEYKNLADSQMNQAYGAQKQANTLIAHVNTLEAQGDAIGAAIERKQASDLLTKAKSLANAAAGNWKTAQKTRLTIPKWQMAAQQAAAYASWEYSNNARVFR